MSACLHRHRLGRQTHWVSQNSSEKTGGRYQRDKDGGGTLNTLLFGKKVEPIKMCAH